MEDFTPDIKKMKLADLEFASYNPREITDKAFEGLQESLRELGLLEMPVVNVADGKKRLVSGHQRARGLIDDGYTYADCIVVEMEEFREKAANLSMNNHAIRGRWDATKAIPHLDKMIARLSNADVLQLDALRKRIKTYGSRDPKKMKVNEVKDDVDAESTPGEIYVLGQHLLACGDALDQDLIERLMSADADDEGAVWDVAACITDPPFGVGYKRDGEHVDLENDEADAGWGTFIREACDLILETTSGPCYVFSSSKELPTFAEAWGDAGGVVHRWLAWIKTNPVVFVTRQVDFNPQFEWVLYGCGKKAKLIPPAEARTNALSYGKPAINTLHPTQKPFDLIKSLVEDAAEVDEVVFDPFSGSGTTLMACEATGRVCVAVEVDPKYVDVARKRWAEGKYGADADWISLTPAV